MLDDLLHQNGPKILEFLMLTHDLKNASRRAGISSRVILLQGFGAEIKADQFGDFCHFVLVFDDCLKDQITSHYQNLILYDMKQWFDKARCSLLCCRWGNPWRTP